MPTTTPTDWQAAMELLLAQLILVLETEGRSGFSVEKLRRWSEHCTVSMERAGVIPAATTVALRELQVRVLA